MPIIYEATGPCLCPRIPNPNSFHAGTIYQCCNPECGKLWRVETQTEEAPNRYVWIVKKLWVAINPKEEKSKNDTDNQ